MPKSKDKRSLETSSDDDFAPKPRSASEEMPPPAPEASTSNVAKAPRLNKAIWEYYDLDPNHIRTEVDTNPKVIVCSHSIRSFAQYCAKLVTLLSISLYYRSMLALCHIKPFLVFCQSNHIEAETVLSII